MEKYQLCARSHRRRIRGSGRSAYAQSHGCLLGYFAEAVPNHILGSDPFNDFAGDWVKAAAPGNPEVVDGYFALPQGPGLGVRLNEDVIREHPQQRIFFNLFAENWHRRQAVQSGPPESK